MLNLNSWTASFRALPAHQLMHITCAASPADAEDNTCTAEPMPPEHDAFLGHVDIHLSSYLGRPLAFHFARTRQHHCAAHCHYLRLSSSAFLFSFFCFSSVCPVSLSFVISLLLIPHVPDDDTRDKRLYWQSAVMRCHHSSHLDFSSKLCEWLDYFGR